MSRNVRNRGVKGDGGLQTQYDIWVQNLRGNSFDGTVEITDGATFDVTTGFVTIQVTDLDLRLTGTVAVTATNVQTTESEAMTLTETATPGVFTGTLTVELGVGPGTDNDGTMLFTDSQTLSVEYIDAVAADGSTNVSRTDTATSTAPVNDPVNTGNIQLLTGFEATPPIDESNFARTITLGGNAVVSSGQVKFGTSALDYSGATPMDCWVAGGSHFNPQAGDMNVDVWMYHNSVHANRNGILHCLNTFKTDGWMMWSTGGTPNYFSLSGYNGSTTPVLDHVTTYALTPGSWNLFSWSWDLSTLTSQLWVNGIDQGQVVASAAPRGLVDLHVSRDFNSTVNYSLGYTDELRIIQGELLPRFGGGNFTVPTAPWGRP